MLDIDWTTFKYESLCEAIIDAGYKVVTLGNYLETPVSTSIILRHDIDRQPENALRIAQIENSFGLTATYFIRAVPGVFSQRIVNALSELGHEIGYHYEVLSKTNGNKEMALELFERELNQLRQFAPVVTAAAHGSPLSKWNNQELWQFADPKDFGLTGEAYQDIDYSQVAYYTDTGRAWDASKTNFRDRTQDVNRQFRFVHTTDELINLVKEKQYSTICIQTHPERWNNMGFGWLRSVLFDLLANSAKRVLRFTRNF